MNLHQTHPSTPLALITSLWNNRQLIWQMTRREVAARFQGSVIGLAWSFITPLLMLAIYTFVFSVIFKARFGTNGSESRIDFAINLFAGLIVFNFFSEVVNRAPKLIVSNSNYVKRVVFPLEILSWVSLGTVLFQSLVSLSVLLLAQLLMTRSLPWTVAFFPLILAPLIFGSLGVCWFLAALGVYIRDIGQITTVLTTMLMFLSAIFYPLSSLPKTYQAWMRLNPLVVFVNESRKVLIWGELPDWLWLGSAWLVGLLIAFAGFWWFQKTRKGFADVL